MEGNQMKMREALLEIETVAGEAVESGTMELPQYSKIVDIAESALSAPPRNCDVGTPEEQEERLVEFCNSTDCGRCPHNRVGMDFRGCTLAWSQMQYEAQEGGAK